MQLSKAKYRIQNALHLEKFGIYCNYFNLSENRSLRRAKRREMRRGMLKRTRWMPRSLTTTTSTNRWNNILIDTLTHWHID